MGSEATATTPISWVDQFRALHPPESLPQEARAAFSDLLDHRTAIRDYYALFPAERFDEGIEKGDSPKKELIHQIGNTRVRIDAITSGSLVDWGYNQLDPKGFSSLQQMDRDRLIGELDSSTEKLFDASSKANMHGTISLPNGKSSSVGDFLWGAVRHEALHLGMAIKFGDYFGIERPASVKKLYG